MATRVVKCPSIHFRRSTVKRHRPYSSVSFSGAGFLMSYHLGVAQCLLEHGVLKIEGEQVVTGVSGGSIVAASLVYGIEPNDSMGEVLKVASSARKNALNIYKPGYSVLDIMELHIKDRLLEKFISNEERMQILLKTKKQLRIGLTDRRFMPPITSAIRSAPHGRSRYWEKKMQAYRYIDTFDTPDDVVASSLLSSYLPGVTGPLFGKFSGQNVAIKKAQRRLKGLCKLGYVKDYHGYSIPHLDNEDNRIIFLDGGLVNTWPVIDDTTLVVTPLNIRSNKHDVICPSVNNHFSYYVQVSPQAQIGYHMDNMETFLHIAWSSVDSKLQEWFSAGHDDAKQFLENRNMLFKISRQSISIP
mmetsp:Transcript_14985/g.22881  ORF Transcript_14985/g.22881 Transcript_14985/m.22881 type:complete len:358 (-) Transcript_14985:445-1518(-)|eukprot:CAMPEP_0178913010 /NCGR_PEP_ID=MMETSP0786-20121207/10598_1 /TAXON_ID=186022 /ORGANISM="Thalassionema frauenfeldii, Strain CCMP 1798" /LENGTH=357 /DNA_ID=CAMNT_0020585691 /DNA_START=85 /DNA_END=1158 /DNA_ORIENTATION=-